MGLLPSSGQWDIRRGFWETSSLHREPHKASLSLQMDMKKKAVALMIASAFKQQNERLAFCWQNTQMQRIWAIVTQQSIQPTPSPPSLWTRPRCFKSVSVQFSLFAEYFREKHKIPAAVTLTKKSWYILQIGLNDAIWRFVLLLIGKGIWSLGMEVKLE